MKWNERKSYNRIISETVGGTSWWSRRNKILEISYWLVSFINTYRNNHSWSSSHSLFTVHTTQHLLNKTNIIKLEEDGEITHFDTTWPEMMTEFCRAIGVTLVVTKDNEWSFSLTTKREYAFSREIQHSPTTCELVPSAVYWSSSSLTIIDHHHWPSSLTIIIDYHHHCPSSSLIIIIIDYHHNRSSLSSSTIIDYHHSLHLNNEAVSEEVHEEIHGMYRKNSR